MFPLIGKTATMLQVMEKIERAAKVDTPILIFGEQGTGKQLVAETIHQQSCRADGPFVVVSSDHLRDVPGSCLPCVLRKLADKGCVNFEEGCDNFEYARGGTLFIDEINRFPNTCQAKLLMSIEQRNGKDPKDREELSDFRLIVATSKPPIECIEQNTLREDLYYQLAIITIQLPALRERKEDIPALVHHFLDKLCAARRQSMPSLEENLMKRFIKHPWPGNVEQLQNCLTCMVTSDEERTVLTEQHFPL